MFNGRRVRSAQFQRRSCLPVSAACLVANGVRETLCSLLGARIGVRLLAPVIPEPAAWSLILADALIYRIRGHYCDAGIVLKEADARTLVATIFGETPRIAQPLSPIEEEVLSRAIRSIAATLAPVCGPMEAPSAGRSSERGGFMTYFEMLLQGPLEARIGMALSRDPVPPAHDCLRIDDLSDVEIELNAEFAHGEIEACELLLLGPGMEVRTNTKVGTGGVLKLAGRIVARGECGALGEHGAFVVGAHPKGGRL